jgi:hypothetical protein
MKPRPDLSRSGEQSLVESLRRAVRDIPTVRSVRVGQRVIHGAGYEQQAPDTADYLVILDFDDLAGLQAYLRHPAHEELGARFNESLSSALVFDFEVGGVEQLSSVMAGGKLRRR